jgi:hypothetical protein
MILDELLAVNGLVPNLPSTYKTTAFSQGAIKWKTCPIWVDQKNGSTYIRKDARLFHESNSMVVEVARMADGYHLTIRSEAIQFNPRNIKRLRYDDPGGRSNQSR